MPTAKKETIYIDIEDELTAVIEKIVSAKGSIAAVVLPKKSTVFLSNVNMKLVKRAADKAKKKLVLITSDKAILGIAASSGVPTAATLTSKPAFPKEKSGKEQEEVTVDMDTNTVVSAVDQGNKDKDAPTDTLELDNTAKKLPVPAAKLDKSDSKKKLKIPNFSSFRLKLGLGVVGLLSLIVLWFFGFVVLPEAKVFVNADISTVTVDESVTLDVAAAALDTENGVVPVERAQVEKINDVTVQATGQKNVGEKATGVINVENCIDSNEQEILPAGTRFSAGSLTFVTTEQVILEAAVTGGGECFSKQLGRDKNVNVEAAEAGPEYNLSEQSYVSSISGINAFGGAMTGGTSSIITVVSQEDIDKAKQQLEDAGRAEALAELQTELQGLGVEPIIDTLAEGEPKTVFTPDIGEESDDVKVTSTITYNLLGVNQSDIEELLNTSIKNTLADAQQNIRDNGLLNVEYTVIDASDNAEQKVQVRTVASVGPDLDLEAIKQQIAGLKRGEIESQLEAIDGVRSVSVEYSPGWVTTTPNDASKITIELSETDDK